MNIPDDVMKAAHEAVFGQGRTTDNVARAIMAEWERMREECAQACQDYAEQNDRTTAEDPEHVQAIAAIASQIAEDCAEIIRFGRKGAP